MGTIPSQMLDCPAYFQLRWENVDDDGGGGGDDDDDDGFTRTHLFSIAMSLKGDDHRTASTHLRSSEQSAHLEFSLIIF